MSRVLHRMVEALGSLTRRCRKGAILVAVNILVLAGLIGAVEIGFRIFANPTAALPPNALWQEFRPYIMFTTTSPEGGYRGWWDEHKKEKVEAEVLTNSLGFAEPRFEYDPTFRYEKKPNERVVLFTGGSVAWGVGATSHKTTTAGRMEHYLNAAQSEVKYTVINQGMGSWIAYQQFIGLDLWGRSFDPDWVVVMDGVNDASVACSLGQGVGVPMYFQIMKSYIHGYLLTQVRPSFYRGWLENETIKYSQAYRTMSGKRYVPRLQTTEEGQPDQRRNVVVKTPWPEVLKHIEFYTKSQVSMVELFPNASYILSTQPAVDRFARIFSGHVSTDPLIRKAATREWQKQLDKESKEYKDKKCGLDIHGFAWRNLFARTAIAAEKVVADYHRRGRTNISYYNVGRLLPPELKDRKPFFIDPFHMHDTAYDLIGKFYAKRILERDFPGREWKLDEFAGGQAQTGTSQ